MIGLKILRRKIQTQDCSFYEEVQPHDLCYLRFSYLGRSSQDIAGTTFLLYHHISLICICNRICFCIISWLQRPRPGYTETCIIHIGDTIQPSSPNQCLLLQIPKSVASPLSFFVSYPLIPKVPGVAHVLLSSQYCPPPRALSAAHPDNNRHRTSAW